MWRYTAVEFHLSSTQGIFIYPMAVILSLWSVNSCCRYDTIRRAKDKIFNGNKWISILCSGAVLYYNHDTTGWPASLCQNIKRAYNHRFCIFFQKWKTSSHPQFLVNLFQPAASLLDKKKLDLNFFSDFCVLTGFRWLILALSHRKALLSMANELSTSLPKPPKACKNSQKLLSVKIIFLSHGSSISRVWIVNFHLQIISFPMV